MPALGVIFHGMVHSIGDVFDDVAFGALSIVSRSGTPDVRSCFLSFLVSFSFQLLNFRRCTTQLVSPVPKMISRHPRFAIGVGFLILCTFLLLANNHSFPPRSPSNIFQYSHGDVPSLQSRLRNAEAAYQNVLQQRKGLIQKFGPTPDKIDM